MKNESWEVFDCGPAAREKFAELLALKEDIFSIESDPAVGGLAACLGLGAEIGNPERDRLSVPLGIDLKKYRENPWRQELIASNGELGIKMWIDGVDEFTPRHPDFAEILHPLSLDENGKLSRIVIFPGQVARRYKARGLELVIVRDWALCPVNYLRTNTWEVENNTAAIQARLMPRAQVAFSGTHDLSDHLLGGQGDGFARSAALYEGVAAAYEAIFQKDAGSAALIASYVLGVVLDDMAQPMWYASEKHETIARHALGLLFRSTKARIRDTADLQPPRVFHEMMSALRSRDRTRDETLALFIALQMELEHRFELPKKAAYWPGGLGAPAGTAAGAASGFAPAG